MAQIEWDPDGTIVQTDENGIRWRMVGAVGPSVIEKKNRYWELEARKRDLEEELNTVSTEQHQIYFSRAARPAGRADRLGWLQ